VIEQRPEIPEAISLFDGTVGGRRNVEKVSRLDPHRFEGIAQTRQPQSRWPKAAA
jgi:hypothetical protein